MANMSRLASEKKLVIAGPFNKPADATWRGIFILDVASLDRAREIVSTDPGIQSGVFIQEAHPFAASPALRRTFELDKKFNAARAANPTEPLTNIRAYVMMTATDGARAAVAIKASTLSTALIFCGTHTDTRAGVFVLDFESVAEVHALIAKEDIDLGPCVVDG